MQEELDEKNKKIQEISTKTNTARQSSDSSLKAESPRQQHKEAEQIKKKEGEEAEQKEEETEEDISPAELCKLLFVELTVIFSVFF